MATIKDKITIEKAALDAKLVKLEAFVASDGGKLVDPAQIKLLKKQEKAMKEYSEVLRERLAILVAPFNEALPE